MRVAVKEIDAGGRRLHVERDGAVLSWAAVAAGLIAEPSLRAALSEALVGAPSTAVYWEARPVAPEDAEQAFECVVLDAPGLARTQADVTSFRGPLAGTRAPAVRRFANLAGDAELVVPGPEEHGDGFPHLAAFLRMASAVQVHALWAELGRGVTEWLAGRGTRVWVSTAGMGVPWLHVRLDSRPKYYKWQAYRAVGG